MLHWFSDTVHTFEKTQVQLVYFPTSVVAKVKVTVVKHFSRPLLLFQKLLAVIVSCCDNRSLLAIWDLSLQVFIASCKREELVKCYTLN